MVSVIEVALAWLAVPSCPPPDKPVLVLTVKAPSPTEIALVEAAVTRPLASTVKDGTAVDEPYTPAVTPLLASVAAAVTFCEPLKDGLVYVTSPVMAIVRPVCKVLAVVAFPLKAALMVPAEKLPEVSRATIVEAVFALVALELTVNVEAVAWLAEKVAPPEMPVPDVLRVSAPSLAETTFCHEAVDPSVCKYFPELLV